MTGADDGPQDLDGDRVGALLRAAGRRPVPSAAQLDRWRRHFEVELAALHRRRRLRRWGALAGACAAAAALVVALLPPSGVEPAQPVAEVLLARGGVVVRQGEAVDALAPGDVIRAGQRVELGLSSRLAIRLGGVDVRLDESTSVVVAAAELELLHGRVYVDTGTARGPGAVPPTGLTVGTPAGRFRHVGTQYLIAVADDEVTGVVREGSLAFAGDGGTRVLRATPSQARVLVVAASGELSEAPAAAHGPLWSWVEAASPGLELAGRDADEVREWIAREHGLRLDYASPAARRLAAQARLGGSGEPLQAGPALAVVEAATGLRTRMVGNATLLAALPSEGDQHAQ